MRLTVSGSGLTTRRKYSLNVGVLFFFLLFNKIQLWSERTYRSRQVFVSYCQKKFAIQELDAFDGFVTQHIRLSMLICFVFLLIGHFHLHFSFPFLH